jgi:hypothetical protein
VITVNDTRLIQASGLIADAQKILDELCEENLPTKEHHEWLSAASKVCNISLRAIRQAALR